MIVDASRFIADGGNILKIFLTIFLIRFIYKFLMKNLESFRHLMHKRFLKFPLFGDLIVKATVSRMCMIMANLTRVENAAAAAAAGEQRDDRRPAAHDAFVAVGRDGGDGA